MTEAVAAYAGVCGLSVTAVKQRTGPHGTWRKIVASFEPRPLVIR
jgi:hypothetical protein